MPDESESARSDASDDATLIVASARGDASAFATLVRRHIRAATLLAAQMLGDRDDAEDIVQAAFTIVYQKARSFDATRPFTPWLFGIVRRLAANRRNRDARRARLLRIWGRHDMNETHADAGGPDVDAGPDAEAALRAMAELSPMQRACFELVVVRDISIEEVAAMHGIAESTVRQHVFRARRALGDALHASGGKTGSGEGEQ